MVRKKTKLASGMMKNNQGFGLLEIMIAVAIIGMVTAIAVPNFTRRMPRMQRENFISSLSNLTQFAHQHALMTRKLHKVIFDITKRKAWIEQEANKDSKGETLFVPIKSNSLRAHYSWSEQFVFRNFFIEGVDELSRYGNGKKTEDVWFFIVPDGLAQEVVINIADIKDTFNKKARHIGLVLNPFTAQFKVYDEYQK